MTDERCLIQPADMRSELARAIGRPVDHFTMAPKVLDGEVIGVQYRFEAAGVGVDFTVSDAARARSLDEFVQRIIEPAATIWRLSWVSGQMDLADAAEMRDRARGHGLV